MWKISPVTGELYDDGYPGPDHVLPAGAKSAVLARLLWALVISVSCLAGIWIIVMINMLGEMAR